mmetsp:Transcript_11777/g.37366  ORF Transcript_11777/g.37366 Transcript_11777/m.37366 type:complete len:212 (-) Transcript_11777:940-1575(-)
MAGSPWMASKCWLVMALRKRGLTSSRREPRMSGVPATAMSARAASASSSVECSPACSVPAAKTYPASICGSMMAKCVRCLSDSATCVVERHEWAWRGNPGTPKTACAARRHQSGASIRTPASSRQSAHRTFIQTSRPVMFHASTNLRASLARIWSMMWPARESDVRKCSDSRRLPAPSISSMIADKSSGDAHWSIRTASTPASASACASDT